MSNFAEPPPIIHSARTICYAFNDESVEFTDRINLYVGADAESMERVGEMPCLAICSNYCVPGDILLFFCNLEWEPKGTIPFESIEEAKSKAERGYKGITDKWINLEISDNELERYLAEEYGVDPNTEWWKTECFICGRESSEVETMIAGKKGYICEECIKTCYEGISSDGNA